MIEGNSVPPSTWKILPVTQPDAGRARTRRKGRGRCRTSRAPARDRATAAPSGTVRDRRASHRKHLYQSTTHVEGSASGLPNAFFAASGVVWATTGVATDTGERCEGREPFEKSVRFKPVRAFASWRPCVKSIFGSEPKVDQEFPLKPARVARSAPPARRGGRDRTCEEPRAADPVMPRSAPRGMRSDGRKES